MLENYRYIFSFPAFRRFWVGFTFSVLGDMMGRVALTWFVYERTRAPEALGLLSVTYLAPVIIGGLIAGPLLDRFDRRKLMIVDNVVRGGVMLLLPLLHGLGTLELWHIYAASLVYGSFVMISLAGSPSLVPALVDRRALVTANALETLSYTLAGVIGPLIAGVLIPAIGAANVVLVDAASYLFFAVMLGSLPAPVSQREPRQPGTSAGLGDAVRLLLGNRVLLSTTVMFMLANLGMGALLVTLPILADQVLGGGANLYGLLLGAIAVGEVISSFGVGSIRLPLSLGSLIAVAQLLSGLALLVALGSLTLPGVIVSFVLLGLFSAPLTIWAQTLRMQIIPDHLRGRTFALLRTLMQSTNPLGGALGGFLLTVLSVPAILGFTALAIGVPGAFGLLVAELRAADETRAEVEPAH